jgi:hypothetical protein
MHLSQIRDVRTLLSDVSAMLHFFAHVGVAFDAEPGNEAYG